MASAGRRTAYSPSTPRLLTTNRTTTHARWNTLRANLAPAAVRGPLLVRVLTPARITAPSPKEAHDDPSKNVEHVEPEPSTKLEGVDDGGQVGSDHIEGDD